MIGLEGHYVVCTCCYVPVLGPSHTAACASPPSLRGIAHVYACMYIMSCIDLRRLTTWIAGFAFVVGCCMCTSCFGVRCTDDSDRRVLLDCMGTRGRDDSGRRVCVRCGVLYVHVVHRRAARGALTIWSDCMYALTRLEGSWWCIVCTHDWRGSALDVWT